MIPGTDGFGGVHFNNRDPSPHFLLTIGASHRRTDALLGSKVETMDP